MPRRLGADAVAWATSRAGAAPPARAGAGGPSAPSRCAEAPLPRRPSPCRSVGCGWDAASRDDGAAWAVGVPLAGRPAWVER
eukprot:11807565-Alexandrium_andersonii.AAC.1